MSDEPLYSEMGFAITSYESGRISFRQLLDRLEECVDQIADTEWQEGFRPLWGRMEDAYAYAAAMGWKQIPSDRMPDVLAALSKAKKMIFLKNKGLAGKREE